MQPPKSKVTEIQPAAQPVRQVEFEYLTVVEAATRSRLKPKTLYNWISIGKIGRKEGVHHVGRKVVIHWPTFEAIVLRGGEMRGAA